MVDTIMTPQQERQYRQQKRKEAHSKRIQGALGVAAAAAGATGAGLVATGKVKKLPHIVERGYTVGTGSAGLGAIAGFNAARNQFKEANRAQKESQQKMNNVIPFKKSLADIAKAASAAVPKDSLAWRMAGTRDDERWREHVSPGARFAYDAPLGPSRKKSRQWGTAGTALIGGGAAGTTLAALASKAPRNARLLGGGAGLAAVAGGVEAKRRSNRYDEASRKIRARGMQRLIEANVEKAFLPIPKVPGSFTRSAVVRAPSGRMYSRRGFATGVRRPSW